MRISLREENGFTIIDIGENVNVENVRELEAVLNEAIKSQKLHLALNLSNVNYLCSHCMSVLIRVWKRLAGSNGSIRIISPDPLIRQMLISTNINKIMGIYSSEAIFKRELASRPAKTTFNVREHGKFRILDIEKPVTVTAGLRELEGQIARLIEAGHKQVVLNLCQSDIFFSEFAGLISKYFWELDKRSGQLALLGVSDATRERMSTLGLDRLIPIWDNESDMTKALSRA